MGKKSGLLFPDSNSKPISINLEDFVKADEESKSDEEMNQNSETDRSVLSNDMMDFNDAEDNELTVNVERDYSSF